VRAVSETRLPLRFVFNSRDEARRGMARDVPRNGRCVKASSASIPLYFQCSSIRSDIVAPFQRVVSITFLSPHFEQRRRKRIS